MANPFAAFQQQQASAPAQVASPMSVTQSGNPFGSAPVQQPPQTPMQPVAAVGFAGAPQSQQPQQAAGFGAGYALTDLSDVGESGRDPDVPYGLSRLKFKANFLKTRQGHTAIAQFTIVSSEDTSKAPGTQVGFVKKVPVEVDKRKTAIGYALPMVRAMAGFTDETTFKNSVPYWAQLLAAFINGDPKFAEWARALPNGGMVGTRGSQGSPVIDKKTGQATGRFYTAIEWFPIPAGQ